MKTARILLACALASTLAACSADALTGPARGDKVRFDSGSQIGSGSSVTAPSSGGVSGCTTVTNPDGSSTCLDSKSQIGSGS